MTALREQTQESQPRPRMSPAAFLNRFGLIVALLIVVAIFSVVEPSTYFNIGQLQSVATTQAVVAVLALGAVMPLIVGQFDVSIGFQLGLSQAICAKLIITHHVAWPLACLAAIGACAVVGAFNGLLVCRVRLSSFIATLGTGTLVLGLTEWYTSDQQVAGALPSAFTTLGRNKVAGVPFALVYVLILMLVLWVAFEYTSWGREAHASGGNPRAALLAGVRVDRVTWQCFIGAGVLSGFSGVLSVSLLGASAPSVGLGELLPAFAAAFLGATAIRPGRFNSIGTVVAIFLLAAGITGLQLLGAQSYVSDLFNGGALLVAITVAAFTTRRRGA